MFTSESVALDSTPELDFQAMALELEDIEKEMARRRLFDDGVAWIEERLGDTLWSKQKEIVRSIQTFRKTAVRSCHEVGKSFIAAAIVAWWLDRDKTGDAFVVTSAPTGHQVKAILWREINRCHTRGKLRGRVNQTSWYMTTVGDKEEIVAFGRKPDDYEPTAFQGIHAPRVLVVFDEACGIAQQLWEAADSLIANDQSKLLVIGNPDDPETEFAQVCKPGSGYNVIEISAFDSPNFTGEPMPEKVLQQLVGRTYVEEKRRKWAPRWFWVDNDGNPSDMEHGVRCVPPDGAKIEETNPLWQSKVLGRFPEKSIAGGLIPWSWITAAQRRSLDPKETDPHRLGVDVGAGGDESVIGEARGPVFRILHEDRNPDTMQTCGNVIHFLEKTGAQVANIDMIGIGTGIYNRGVELEKPFVGVNVGKAAKDPEHFTNLRADLYWQLRERFEKGLIDLDPDDDDTAAELAEFRYKRLSSGKIQMESKDEMKKRTHGKSPNRAEACMLAFADVAEEEWVIE